MSAAAYLLPPVVVPQILQTPLTVWSAAVFLAVALAAFFVARHRRSWALGLLVFWTPFAFYRDIAGTTITIEKALLVGVIAALLSRGARLVPQASRARALMLAGLVLLATTFLSMLHAAYAVPVLREASKLVEYLALAWCAIAIVSADREEAELALSASAISALVVVALYAIWQAIGGGAPSGIWVNNTAVPRVAGSLEGPNQLAGYLEVMLPIAWLSPLLRDGVFAKARFIGIAAAMAALVLTQSRAGFGVLLLAYGALWFIDRPAARSSLVPVLTGLAVGFSILLVWYARATGLLTGVKKALTQFVTGRFGQPGGLSSRLELWRAAIELFKRSPFFGVGAGNFELSLGKVGLAGVRTHANSLWLQTLAEQGVLGFAALATLAGVSIRVAISGAASSWLARAALVATACLLIHQFVDDLFFFPKIGGAWWLLIGAATAASANASAGRASATATAAS